MADKPSRAMVLYGDGLARFVNPSHTHLHSLASRASCGFLSLPIAPTSETEDERIVREFAVMLDAYESYLDQSGGTTEEECGKESSIKTLSERFMGMKAAIFTSNSSLKSFAAKLGFSVFQIYGPPAESVESELLKLLGFQGGETVETSQYDIVFVHVGAGEVNVEKGKAISADVEYLNALVDAIGRIAQPGSEIGSHLHLSVVLSYGNVSEKDDPNLSVLTIKDDRNPDLSKFFPRQSYTMRGENPRKDVRHHCPMLIAQWQYAVTRKDMADTFSFEDFKEHSGNLVIPADRFLHEVAFKLWKAPKYGA